MHKTITYSCKCGKSFPVMVYDHGDGDGATDVQANSCKFCEPPELNFAQIDGKVEQVVGVAGRWCQDDRPRGDHNYRVCVEAQKEYLERLDALQKEIRDKYQPRLQPQGDTDDADNSIAIMDEVYGKEMENRPYRRFQHLFYT